MSAKLGEILVRENLISPQHLRQALDYQRDHGGRLRFNLVKLGLVSDDTITAVLSRQYGIPSVNLELFDIDDSVLRLIPQEVAQKYSVLPLSRVGATLTLAMVDPTNVFAMDDIKFMTGLNVEPVVVAEASVQASIAKYYSSSREIELAHVAPDFAAEGANGNGFSDADLVSLDNLEFDQESVDGEVDVLEDNEEIDLSSLARMSEDAPVVRLVNVLLVDALRRGASDIHVEPYEKELRIRFRIDGVLYDVMHPPLKMRDALISRIKIKFNLPCVNQVQMKAQIGLNFAAALRSFLRQDPNIVLVGEIRDFETAEIAIKAALTGHLVLSTLHTNDAPSTISRLMNMGIEPFLVATSVNLICAQRLVRRICTNCKEPLGIPQQALLDGGFTPEEAKATTIYHGRGCGPCNKSGYKGRVGLYEVMEINDELRELILVGASAVELKKKALDQGMITLRRSGLIKAAAGLTTLEEVLRESVL